MSAIGAFAGVARGVTLGSVRPSGGNGCPAVRRVTTAGRVVPGFGGAGAVSGLGSRASHGVVGGAILAARRASKSVAADRRVGLRVVARAAGAAPEQGDTRLGSGFSRISADVRNQVRKNFTKLPVAIFCLLCGFAITALFPHPESPGDAPICFTIIFLCEFLSSVLYSPKRPRGLLKWLKVGTLIPLGEGRQSTSTDTDRRGREGGTGRGKKGLARCISYCTVFSQFNLHFTADEKFSLQSFFFGRASRFPIITVTV